MFSYQILHKFPHRFENQVRRSRIFPDKFFTIITIGILFDSLKLSVYANFSHKKIPPKSISNFGGTHQIVTSRLLIFIILAINIVMLLWQISSQPMWLLLKSIYLVFTICIMEIVFRRIRETFGSPNLNLTLILLLIIYGVLIII